MKKITRITLLFLLLSATTFAGRDHRYDAATIKQSNRLSNGQTGMFLNFNPFYSEDFSSGIPAGWQVIDTASPAGINWRHTTTGSNGGASLSSTGTSAANGYMIYDSDSAGQSLGGENADLISGVINCTGHSTVVLNFNEYLTHYNDTATVQISTDGVSWTEVHNSSSGLNMYASTSNPNNVDIDITSIAANQDTVYIRFNYRADYSYYWMIDDVKLYELPSIDGAVSGIAAPLTNCTVLSASETVEVTIHNNGGDSINGNFAVTMILDNGTPVTENVSDTITAGSDLLYTFTATADLSTPGPHTLLVYISVPGDTNTVNDTLTSSIFSGPHVVNPGNDYTNGFEPSDDVSGFLIEDSNNDTVSWVIDNLLPHSGSNAAHISGPNADDWMFTTCLDLDTSYTYNLTYYYRTATTSTQAMLEVYLADVQSSGGIAQVIHTNSQVTSAVYLQATDVFTPPLSGSYYIGFHAQKSDSLVALFIDDINITTDTGGVGIKNPEKLNVSVYPNPSQGIVYLNTVQNSFKGFTIEVRNPLGQIILTRKCDRLKAFTLDLNEQPDGIYLVKVNSENGTYSTRVTISK